MHRRSRSRSRSPVEGKKRKKEKKSKEKRDRDDDHRDKVVVVVVVVATIQLKNLISRSFYTQDDHRRDSGEQERAHGERCVCMLEVPTHPQHTPCVSHRHRSSRRRSSSPSPDRSHKRHHRSSDKHDAPGADANARGGGDVGPQLSHEEMVKKQREDEQAALDAQMEERRKRVEEWRRKRLQEQVRRPSVQISVHVVIASPSQGLDSEAATKAEVKSDEQMNESGEQQQGDEKGWTLEDDADDDADGGEVTDAAAAMPESNTDMMVDGAEPVAPAEAPAAAAAVDEVEIDPLDAFMMGNTEQLVKDDRQIQQQHEDDEEDPLDAFMSEQVLPRVHTDLASAAAPPIKREDSGLVKIQPIARANQGVTGLRLPAVARKGQASAGKGQVGRRRVQSSGESSSDEEEEESSEEDDAVSTDLPSRW